MGNELPGGRSADIVISKRGPSNVGTVVVKFSDEIVSGVPLLLNIAVATPLFVTEPAVISVLVTVYVPVQVRGLAPGAKSD